MRRSLSSLNPFFYFIIVTLRRLERYIKWLTEKKNIAKTISENQLDYRIYKHQSVLIRTLGDSDLTLQYNKVVNLKIAIQKLNGIIIKPGEKFSFWYLVGLPTRKKGYLDGMLLSEGEAISGLGGGLCQIVNLINWICLHSPLTVIERHHHSYDPFPDSGRVVPFGSGAGVFYNYIDYQFINTTEHTFQLLFWFDDKYINGDLRVNNNLPYKYHVFEKNHQFVKIKESFYRRNELWREKYDKKSGDIIETELLQKNNALAKYVPDEYVVL
jgi:vancomycin resistance protein VanW